MLGRDSISFWQLGMARGVGIAVCVLVMVVCIILVPGVRGNGAPKVPMSSILDAFRFRGYKQHEVGGSSAGGKEQEEEGDMIWPMPVSVTHGKGSLILDSGVFQFAVEDGKKAPATLVDAFLRYRAILFPSQSHASLSTFTSSSRMLEKLLVRLDSANEEVHLNSYSGLVWSSFSFSVGSHHNQIRFYIACIVGLLMGQVMMLVFINM